MWGLVDGEGGEEFDVGEGVGRERIEMIYSRFQINRLKMSDKAENTVTLNIKLNWSIMLSATLMNQDVAGHEMKWEATYRSLHAPAETVWLSQLDSDVTTGNLNK